MIHRTLLASLLCASFLFAQNAGHSQAQPGKFTQAHAVAISATPAGVTFRLSFEGEHRTFHRGEPIPVTFSFTSDKPNAFQLIHFDLPFSESVEIDPEAGTTAPDADILKGNGFSGNAYMPEPDILSKAPVHSITLLNTYFRFDTPGHYRIFAVTQNVLSTAPLTTPPVKATETASDIIDFDIVPDDPAWERSQLNIIKKNLKSNDATIAANAERDLEFLGTNDAVTEILQRLKGSPQYPWPLIKSLFAARDRRFVVDSLTNTISSPDFAVSEDLLTALARLDVTMRHPLKERTTVGILGITQEEMDREKVIANEQPVILAGYYRMLQNGLDAKRGRARAVSLVTLLNNAAKNPHAIGMDIEQSRRVAATLRTSLPLLSEVEQAQLLSGPAWPALKQLDIVPYLDWASRLHGTINGDTDNYDLREAAIKRLMEVNPTDARSIILKDIRSGEPEMGFDTLEMLPDAEIPSLDPVFKKNLVSGNGSALVYCLLISRYATRALLPLTRSVYPIEGDPIANNYLLTYFLRVDEKFAEKLIDQELRQQIRDKQYMGLLSSMVDARPTPALERIVRAHLHDRDKTIANDAKNALARIADNKKVK